MTKPPDADGSRHWAQATIGWPGPPAPPVLKATVKGAAEWPASAARPRSLPAAVISPSRANARQLSAACGPRLRSRKVTVVLVPARETCGWAVTSAIAPTVATGFLGLCPPLQAVHR